MVNTVKTYWTFINAEVEFWLGVWDFRYRKAPPPCSANLICECNRRSCPYRQVSVITYVRKLKQLEG